MNTIHFISTFSFYIGIYLSTFVHFIAFNTTRPLLLHRVKIEKERSIVEDEHKKQSEDIACISIIHQNLEIEAIVQIKPRVIIGDDFSVECGDYIICRIDEDPKQKVRNKNVHNYKYGKTPHHDKDDDCTFLIKQELCLRIPLIFSAKAVVKSEKAVCLDTHVEPSTDCEED